MVDELLVTIAPFFLITAAAVVVGELNFVLNIGPWEWDPSRGFLGICHKDRGNLHDRDGLGVDDEDIRITPVLMLIAPFMTEKRVAGTAEGPSGYKSLCVYLYDLYDHYNDYDDNRDVCEIPVSGRHKIVENWVYCRAEKSMSGGELSMCHVPLSCTTHVLCATF